MKELTERYRISLFKGIDSCLMLRENFYSDISSVIFKGNKLIIRNSRGDRYEEIMPKYGDISHKQNLTFVRLNNPEKFLDKQFELRVGDLSDEDSQVNSYYRFNSDGTKYANRIKCLCKHFIFGHAYRTKAMRGDETKFPHRLFNEEFIDNEEVDLIEEPFELWQAVINALRIKMSCRTGDEELGEKLSVFCTDYMESMLSYTRELMESKDSIAKKSFVNETPVFTIKLTSPYKMRVTRSSSEPILDRTHSLGGIGIYGITMYGRARIRESKTTPLYFVSNFFNKKLAGYNNAIEFYNNQIAFIPEEDTIRLNINKEKTLRSIIDSYEKVGFELVIREDDIILKAGKYSIKLDTLLWYLSEWSYLDPEGEIPCFLKKDVKEINGTKFLRVGRGELVIPLEVFDEKGSDN